MTRPDSLYGLHVPYDKSVEELIQITKERPPICWTAYTALGYHNSGKSIDALTELLNTDDWTHKRSAIEAIGINKKGLQLEKPLIDFLVDTNKFIVTASIKSLSNLHSLTAHDKIKELVDSENIEIKHAAIEGLSTVWKPDDFAFLIDTYKTTTTESSRKKVGYVLAEHTDESNWRTFYDTFKIDRISRHREWALTSAIEFSGDKELIEPFLNDTDGHIRKKASRFAAQGCA
jgi:HEAT repeat protein